MHNGYYESPIGSILISANDDAVHQLSFVKGTPEGFDNTYCAPLIEEARRQLALYFSKELKNFDLPLAFNASGFQKQVMEEVLKIPFGQTVTYAPQRLGSIRLTRAVAGANAANANLIV